MFQKHYLGKDLTVPCGSRTDDWNWKLDRVILILSTCQTAFEDFTIFQLSVDMVDLLLSVFITIDHKI